MEYGNIKLSKIVQMQIDTLGSALFYDTKFGWSENEPEWANFKQKIKTEKNINLEDTILVKTRIKKIKNEIFRNIFGSINEKDLKSIFMQFTEDQLIVAQAFFLFLNIFFSFFEQLKKNISNFLPCDIPQNFIVQYTFAKHINKFLNYQNPLIKGRLLPLYSNKEKAELFEKILCYFFKKNNMGFYEPSLEQANKQIKDAFKNAGKSILDLKQIVDTDKGKNLNKASTTWKTVKKILDEENNIFKGIDKTIIIQYKLNYFIYMILKNFEKTIDSLIPQNIRSKIIEDILNNIEYLKSLRDYHFEETRPVIKKIPESAMEYILYNDNRALETLPPLFSICDGGYLDLKHNIFIDFFWYNRSTPDNMKQTLEYGAQEKYIEMIEERSSSILKNMYGKDTFYQDEEAYFQEKFCCKEKIGESASFFYLWYSARIEYAKYLRNKSTIEKVSQAYLNAYDIGLYFSGKYTRKFVKEAIKIFLEEYKKTKRTGRIKEVYQYATALGLTLQLYKKFKEANFTDPAINPYEWFIELWDSGHNIIDIAQITGLNWQTVRKILSDNEKFLKRNDKASLKELDRYITKWECDEYNIDTDEDWD